MRDPEAWAKKQAASKSTSLLISGVDRPIYLGRIFIIIILSNSRCLLLDCVLRENVGTYIFLLINADSWVSRIPGEARRIICRESTKRVA